MEPPAAHAESWARAPVMVHLLNEVDIYAAPPAAGSELKFGCGQHRRPGDPDNLDPLAPDEAAAVASAFAPLLRDFADYKVLRGKLRSEEHTSALQSLMRIPYAVFCLKKNITTKQTQN